MKKIFIVIFAITMVYGCIGNAAAFGNMGAQGEYHRLTYDYSKDIYGNEICNVAKIQLKDNDICEIKAGSYSFKTKYLADSGKVLLGSVNNDYAIMQILNVLTHTGAYYDMKVIDSNMLQPEQLSVENFPDYDPLNETFETYPTASIQKYYNIGNYPDVKERRVLSEISFDGAVDYFISNEGVKHACVQPYLSYDKPEYYLPLRSVFEYFGFQVDWDGKTKTIKITNPDSFTGRINLEEDGTGNAIIDNVNTFIDLKYKAVGDDILIGDGLNDNVTAKILYALCKEKNFHYQVVGIPEKQGILFGKILGDKGENGFILYNGQGYFEDVHTNTMTACTAPTIDYKNDISYLPIMTILDQMGYHVDKSEYTTEGKKIITISFYEY